MSCVYFFLFYFVLLFFFFFFKQKTAYEMRISDWSSDVCSSDLVRFGISALVFALFLLHTARIVPLRLLDVVEAFTYDARVVLKIGRASCRERVCQYV